MNQSDIEQRLVALMKNITTVGSDGTAVVSPDLVTLHDDIERALTREPDNMELAMLAEALSGLRQTLSDPFTAQELVNAQQNPPPPDPPLIEAIDTGDIDILRAALATCDVNETYGEYDQTPLYHAVTSVEGLSLPIVNVLLDAGADPRKGLTDCNVLHGLGFARTRDADPGDLALFVKRCVDLGADIEERTNNLQWTPLITAVSEWEPVATEALLMAGADIHVRAGDTGMGCYSGADCWDFATGNNATLAVLNTYRNRL